MMVFFMCLFLLDVILQAILSLADCMPKTSVSDLSKLDELSLPTPARAANSGGGYASRTTDSRSATNGPNVVDAFLIAVAHVAVAHVHAPDEGSCLGTGRPVTVSLDAHELAF